MSNWIDSGGDMPRACSRPETTSFRFHGHLRWNSAMTGTLAVLLLVVAATFGHARDRGQFANSSPELKAWFDGLRSGKGPCCSDADGTALSDADWEISGGHYRVRVPRHDYEADDQRETVWVDVPDEAVISEPNQVGRTLVWPIYGYLGVSIRCFMPGSMT